MKFRQIMQVMFALTLAACAGVPEIPYDRGMSPPVKTIGILTPGMPDGVLAVLANSVGQSFGIVGALVEASMQSEREKKLAPALSKEGFVFQTVLLERIMKNLQADGYTVSNVPFQRSSNTLAKVYPKGETNVDAYLDLSVPFYGYIAAGVADPYRPFLTLNARLVRATDGSVLMQDVVAYNPYLTPKNVVSIAPDPFFQYGDFESVMANAPNAIRGLREATEKTADGLTALLK